MVLSRRINETIMIGDDVTITVLGISQGQVRIGISAPREVPVHRSEIFDKIKKEQLGINPDLGGNV